MVGAVVVGFLDDHALPVARFAVLFPPSLVLSLSLPRSRFLSLYHARGEEAAAAKLRRVEVGPGERGHRSWT